MPSTQCLTLKRGYQGFTLVELMVSITIIVVLATTVLFGMAGVQNTAKAARTRSQIARIHEIIAEKWESYETRRLQFVAVPPGDPQLIRLRALRELIRLEIPDRRTDVLPNQSLIQVSANQFVGRTGIAQPTLSKYYISRVLANPNNWTKEFEDAECLYMILSRIQVGDSNGLEFFSEQEIGDFDGDGMPEILDAWGRPIRFLRWAPGYANRNIANGYGISSYQSGDPVNNPDTMDLASADPRLRNDDVPANDTFALFPLIFSTGPDGEANILTDFDPELVYRDTDSMPYHNFGLSLVSDPYVSQNGTWLGQVIDATKDGHIDNIYSHNLDTKL